MNLQMKRIFATMAHTKTRFDKEGNGNSEVAYSVGV